MDLIDKFLNNEKIELEDLMVIEHLNKDNLEKIEHIISDFTWNKYESLTYSRNYFIPLTNMCRNDCSYCGFRVVPSDPYAHIYSPEEIIEELKWANFHKCKEVLITFGEKPESKYPEFIERLRKFGDYNSLHEYHLDVCKIILEQGFLPHSNSGLLTNDELKDLKEVNASMGLMLESSSERLCEKGGPHEKSPSKHPKKRLEMIENAGKLKIPFTTGILIGIGETFTERIESLLSIQEIHEKYGHIQEIIIQNCLPYEGTRMWGKKPISIKDILKVIYCARLIFRDTLSIQVPPNLNLSNIDKLLFSGINDLGGISPITKDAINPNSEWPEISELKEYCKEKGLKLKERLAVYPKYMNEDFLSQKVLKNIKRFLNK